MYFGIHTCENMAMKAVAAAALMACIGSANAQSTVTIYGRVDVSVQSRNRSVDDSGSQTIMHTGGIRPSIWGIKGSEDLGNGLKAGFALEGQFDGSDGSTLQAPGFDSQLFRRQANVSIGGDWGAITLGRQYSPFIFGTIGVEPRAWKEQFSQLFQLAYNHLAAPGDPFGAGTNTGNDIGVFIGNAIQYSNNFGPVYLGVAYSFGEQSGGFSKGNQVSIGASYTGPVTVGFGFHNIKDAVSGEDVIEAWDLGVAVPLGDFTGRLNYLSITNNVPTTGEELSDVKSIGLGVDYKWSDRNTAGAVFYTTKYQGAGAGSSKSKAIVLSNDYAFSKKTTLYGQLAYEDSDALVSTDGLEFLKRSIVLGGTTPGKKTSLVSVGISHNF